MNFRLTTLLWMAAAFFAAADVREFRIDQDRLWLRAEDEPLPRLLERFAAVGIQVQIDPAVQKLITGKWVDADAEKVLDRLIYPYDYSLDWSRETGPLGSRTILTGIRVFRKGFAAEAKPLKYTRRVATSLDGKQRFLDREILVGFKPGTSMNDLKALLARLGGTVIATHPELGIYRILLPEGANVLALLEELKRDETIAKAEPNYVYDLPGLLPGGTSSTDLVRDWTPPSGDGTIAVSVLDSGLIPSEGLNAAILSSFDATQPGSPLTTDSVGHGTLMAQLAAGLLDPYGSTVGEGMNVVAIKAFADDGLADSYTLMNAIVYAVKSSDGPISLSWGTETPSQFIENAIQYALRNGSLVFAAVGNENTGQAMYPAAYPGVVGVAAGTADGQYTDYSNRGDFVDIIVPGAAGGSQGTSVATAYISRVAAQYQSMHPKASQSDITEALYKAAGEDGYFSFEDEKIFLAR